jgi:hypothetical protein
VTKELAGEQRLFKKKELRTLAVLFFKYGIKEVSSRQEKKAKEIAI